MAGDMTGLDPIRITYRIRATAAALDVRLEALLLEQTVELSRAALDAFGEPDLVRDWTGAVESVRPDGADAFVAVLRQPAAATGGDPVQLLNVLFGNSSLQPDVELLGCELPGDWPADWGRPPRGIAGWREATGAAAGPLTATALKPMGLPTARLAALAAQFAAAGFDVIKDDHGLASQAPSRFADRLAACVEAVGGAAPSGRRPLYVPNLIGTPDTVRRQAEAAVRAGVRAVLVSPLLVGPGALVDLRREFPSLLLLAHPAYAGAARMAPPALLGTVLRHLGADASIFPHHGGRFAYDAPTCAAIARELTRPRPGRPPALPVPAGGLGADQAAAVVRFYGPDVMLLIGGSLYQAGPDLPGRARDFVLAARAAASTPSAG